MRAAAPAASRSPACRKCRELGSGVTMPAALAVAFTRSSLDMRASCSSRSEFWRSSVVAVSAAREMPVLSFSSDTCIATMPPSITPTRRIQVRLRSRLSTRRCSGSPRKRSNGLGPPRRGAPPTR
jgi:hypothetical protein